MPSTNGRTVFITGGAGFIGSHLTERLISEGYKVNIFDNLHRNAIKYTDILNHPGVTFTQGDILDPVKLKEAMKGADIVMHLAAIAGVSNYYNFHSIRAEGFTRRHVEHSCDAELHHCL